jgi:hypothetical protein
VRAIHFAHAAGADAGDDFIRPKRLARGKRHDVNKSSAKIRTTLTARSSARHAQPFTMKGDAMNIDERMEFVLRSIESHDRQIGELVDGLSQLRARVDTLTGNIETLVKVSNRDGVDILKRAHIAEDHDKRIEDLEGRE